MNLELCDTWARSCPPSLFASRIQADTRSPQRTFLLWFPSGFPVAPFSVSPPLPVILADSPKRPLLPPARETAGLPLRWPYVPMAYIGCLGTGELESLFHIPRNSDILYSYLYGSLGVVISCKFIGLLQRTAQ